MQRYLGVKIINAEPQQREKWMSNKFEDRDDHSLVDGYKVVYQDGYKSWSPKDVFEKAYRRTDKLTFGMAIEALKLGHKVARTGWNGKNMFLFYVEKYNWAVVTDDPTEVELCPFIAMKTADNKFIPWLASQTDMLAEDWQFVI